MLPNYSYVIFTGTIFDNAVVRCPCAEFYGTWRGVRCNHRRGRRWPSWCCYRCSHRRGGG